MQYYKTKLSNFLLILLIISSVFSSCSTSREKIVYFVDSEGKEFISTTKNNSNFTPKFKIDDLISIEVFATDEEAAAPFNTNIINTNMVRTGYNNGIPAMRGHLVDSEGYINFPILGKIEVAGKTRQELTKVITELLQDYLKNPIVKIDIINFKVTVLGDVRSPGSYYIPNERITLLEAIGISGDLNPTAKRNNILVVRDIDGIKKNYRIDLTKGDLFDSEIYYLQQNDVVYIEPNRAKRNSGLLGSATGAIVSISSLLISTAVLIIRL